MEKIKILLLHGFWGRPQDWDSVVTEMSGAAEVSNAFEAHRIDYMNLTKQIGPKNSFENWANYFADWIRQEYGPGPHGLVGYSLGGRLALHALEESPDLFSRGVLISTHPGLESEGERSQRIQADEVWAQRFLHDSWELLMEVWNKQDVFIRNPGLPSVADLVAGLVEPDYIRRRESDHSREALALVLRNWSLGRQKDFRFFLQKTRVPITWMTGAQDTKFQKIASELQGLGNQVQFQSIESAGHRVLIDDPKGLGQALRKQFLK